jgi:catechol 2,3-dioxygenase-like lactoylglutathione lyase family enzyme
MPTYSYDHIHLRSRDPLATAQWYQRMLDARVIESVQSDGAPRVDLDLNGLTVFIARVAPDAAIEEAPPDPHLGLDHFGLRVDNLDDAAAELKRRGATFAVEPRTIRPGVKIAFLQCPDNVRIELLERRAPG